MENTVEITNENSWSLETKAALRGDKLDDKWLLLSIDSDGNIGCSNEMEMFTLDKLNELIEENIEDYDESNPHS